MKKLLTIINYIAAALGVIVVLIGGVNYINGIDSKAQAATDGLSGLQKQRDDDRQEWLTDFKDVKQSADAAEADAAATRKLSQFIVKMLGGNPEKLLSDNATSTNQ